MGVYFHIFVFSYFSAFSVFFPSRQR